MEQLADMILMPSLRRARSGVRRGIKRTVQGLLQRRRGSGRRRAGRPRKPGRPRKRSRCRTRRARPRRTRRRIRRR